MIFFRLLRVLRDLRMTPQTLLQPLKHEGLQQID